MGTAASPIPVDREYARVLAARLADELVELGAIHSPEWRRVFESVPRHVFVPRFFRRTPEGRQVVDGADPEQRSDWLDSVYRNDVLVTRVEGEGPGIATSSSTEPSLMANMLELLDVHDGHKVLEIGTGTGYNAALLCERLGSEKITTIDIDSYLVDLARDRLIRAGYTPTIALADGADGYPDNAPYDRILATCGVRRIPQSWLDQLKIGGKVLVNICYTLESELIALSRLANGSAEGRFLSTCTGFMPMRTKNSTRWSIQELFGMIKGERGDREGETKTTDRPNDIDNNSFLFLAMIHLPSVHAFGADGTATIFESPCLVDPTDGSWMHSDIASGVGTVTQGGPRRLWDDLLEVYALWTTLGKPLRERYGLTVTPEGRQTMWLDSPNSEHRWELPE